METDIFGRKDWDFRRLAAENARLRRDLEELKKTTVSPASTVGGT